MYRNSGSAVVLSPKLRAATGCTFTSHPLLLVMSGSILDSRLLVVADVAVAFASGAMVSPLRNLAALE